MKHSERSGRGRSFVLGALLACLGVVALEADSGELRERRSPDGVWAVESGVGQAGAARSSSRESGSRAFHLSRDVLTRMLHGTLQESRGRSSGALIYLPVSGEVFSKFRLEESPIVAPGQDGRLPEIRTFTIRGVDDPGATGRLSWTGSRLHALVLSDRSGVFIAPRSPSADDSYVLSTDDAVGGAVRCGLTDALDTRLSGASALTAPASPPPVPVLGPTLRVFRAAVAATAEYTAYVTGNEPDPTTAKERAFDEIVATVNAADAVYERDLAIRLVLLPKEDILKIIYTDPGSDPYTSGDTGKMILENQQNLDAVIQSANYDIGHVFDKCSGGLSGSVGIACTVGMKGQGVSGGVCETESFKFQSHYLIHEGAHQMGAPHSFNYKDKFGQYSAYSAYEVGSGSTIMSYAGCDTAGCGDESLQVFPDRYFHASSIAFVTDYVTNGGGACAVLQATANQPPDVAAGLDHDIPSHTPFTLTGAASDPDGDPLQYDWEEYDLGATSPPNDDADGQERPILRSYPPTASPSRTFPSLPYILENGNDPPGFYSGFDRFGTPQTFTVGEMLPRITRTMTFRLTVRDLRGGVNSDDVLLHVDGGSGPFSVTSPDTSVVWLAGSTQTVTWDVAGTANPPVSCSAVDILLSIDGGQTFPLVLAAGTPNDGSQTITLPPGLSSPEARIKVEAVDNVFFDISNKSFVINQAPVVACPTSKTVETDPGQCGAAVPFTATATDDQDGVSVACVPPSGSTFGRGSAAVTCTATDTYGATDSCSFSVTVVDAEAPSIAGLAATPSVLRPPDHKMVDVTVPYQATDNCDALPTVTCALSVTSNEPINGTGDGDKAPDWQILDAHRLRLREERAGSGTGRIYTIGVVCTDGAGNTTAPATTQVLVPLNTML